MKKIDLYEMNIENFDKLKEELTSWRYTVFPIPRKGCAYYEQDILFQEEDRTCTHVGRIIGLPNKGDFVEKLGVISLSKNLSNFLSKLDIK